MKQNNFQLISLKNYLNQIIYKMNNNKLKKTLTIHYLNKQKKNLLKIVHHKKILQHIFKLQNKN